MIATWRRVPGQLVAALSLVSCGYHLGPTPRDPLGPFSLSSSSLRVPEAALAAAAEEGARAELARSGQLAPGRAPAEIEVELLRVDETSEGIAVGPQAAPLSRGVRVSALGRARLRRDGHVVRDTGDVRASDVAATATGVAQAVVVGDEAGRAAARRLGETLVRKLLGMPDPGDP
jgi:hypothetical protein